MIRPKLMSDAFSKNMGLEVTHYGRDAEGHKIISGTFTKRVSREEFNRRVLENFPAINKKDLDILYRRYLEGKYTLE
jgi:hypothetical protein